MMEDHDRAYHVWKELDMRKKTLVHIDAHIDFGWLPEMNLQTILDVRNSRELDELLDKKPLWNPFAKDRRKMVHIGNYICPAIRDGMVEKFYWIVPDPTWRSARGQRSLRDTLRGILKVKQYVNKNLEIRKDCLYCRIHDTDIFIMPLVGLAGLDEGVLLDIDVDFMLTPFVWNDIDPHRAPWIFPEQLVDNVRAKNMDIDALTISYSVNGGFTPVRFKHLGDELRSLFENRHDARAQELTLLKRQSLEHEKGGRYIESISSYEKAIALGGESASTCFNLSLLYLDKKNDLCKARHLYRKAISLDKTYGLAYNNSGAIYLNQGKLRKAQAEYERFLCLDENNAHALSGLGYTMLGRKRYGEAVDLFDRALAMDAGDKRALFGKAMACLRLGRVKAAEDLFVKLVDISPDDSAVFWYLARISEKNGSAQKAVEYYKKAVMAGGEGPLVHLLLCRTYLKKGLYLRAFEEVERFWDFLIKGILGRW
jgi:tetratricopeptide (TPR) repeat protein